MVLLAPSAELGVADLPRSITAARTAGPVFSGPVLPVRDVQRRYAVWALEQLGGHRTRTAEKLGIDLKTLGKWLSETEGTGEKE
jgi:two-component system, NtrC family, response regulator HydG